MAALMMPMFAAMIIGGLNSQNVGMMVKKFGLAVIGAFLIIYTSLLLIHGWGANSLTLAISLFFYQIIAAVLQVPAMTVFGAIIFYDAIKGTTNLWPTGVHMTLGFLMGAAIVIILSQLFLDRSSLRPLPHKLVNIIQSYQQIFSTLLTESIQGKVNSESTNKEIAKTQVLLKETQGLLKQAGVTNSEVAGKIDLKSLQRMASFLIRIQRQKSKLQSNILIQHFAPELNSLNREVKIALEKIVTGIYTKKILNSEEFTFLDQSLLDIEDKLTYLVQTREIEKYPFISCINFYLLLYPIKQFIEAVKQFFSDSPSLPTIAPVKSASTSAKPTLVKKLTDIPADHWRLMFKTSLACGLALAITHGFWNWGGSGPDGGHYYRYTLYSILAVMQLTYEAEIFAGLNRAIITIIAVASAAIAYATIGANPFIIWFGLFLVITSARAVGFAPGFQPGLAAYMITVIDYDPSLYNRYLGQRFLETLFGIAFALAISKLLWPKTESSKLKDQISQGFVKLKNLYGNIFLKYLEGEEFDSYGDVAANIAVIEQFVQKQLAKEQDIGGVIVQNIIALKKPRYSRFYLTYQAEFLDKIKILNYVMAKDEIFLPQGILVNNLIEISETIMQNFQRIAKAIENNAEKLEIFPVLPLFRALDEAVRQLAKNKTFAHYTPESLLVLSEILESLKEIADLMEQMKINWSSPDIATEIHISPEF